jgi:hypothetical protein
MSTTEALPELPPLPKPEGTVEVDCGPAPGGGREVTYADGYTADQMRDYACAALAATSAPAELSVDAQITSALVKRVKALEDSAPSFQQHFMAQDLDEEPAEELNVEQWLRSAERIFLAAGDDEEFARKQARYLLGEEDQSDIGDPYEAALQDVEWRTPAEVEERRGLSDAIPKFWPGERVTYKNEYFAMIEATVKKPETRWSTDRKPYVFTRIEFSDGNTYIVPQSRLEARASKEKAS